MIKKQNLYPCLPERSGGAIIMCNKCRVTKKLQLKEITTFCTVHKGKKAK